MTRATDEMAQRLIRLRENLSISAAELCRQAKIAPNRWSQYETGERPITLDAAKLLRKRFGATLDWIYFGDESGMPLRLLSRSREDA